MKNVVVAEDDKNAVLERIQLSTSLKDMESADFVVEAATENAVREALVHAGLTN